MCKKKTQPQPGENTHRRQAPQHSFGRRTAIGAMPEDGDRENYRDEDEDDKDDDEEQQDDQDEQGEEDDAGADVAQQSPTSQGAAPRPAITQAMLRRILRFKKEAREVEPLIRQVKRALADGAAVEAGSCTLTVRPCTIPFRVPKQLVQALRLSPQRVTELEAAGGAKEGTVAVIREYGEVNPFGE